MIHFLVSDIWALPTRQDSTVGFCFDLYLKRDKSCLDFRPVLILWWKRVQDEKHI